MFDYPGNDAALQNYRLTKIDTPQVLVPFLALLRAMLSIKELAMDANQ